MGSKPYQPRFHSLARPIHFETFLGSVIFWTLISKSVHQRIRWGWYSRRCLNIFSIKVGDDGCVKTDGQEVLHFSVDSILTKPSPLRVPLVSQMIQVEINWPKGFSIPSGFCSSIDNGEFEMYKFVGSCSCCYGNKSEKMNFISLNPLPPSAVIRKMTFQKRERKKGWLNKENLSNYLQHLVPLPWVMRHILSLGWKPHRSTISSTVGARAHKTSQGRSFGLSL